MNVLILGIDGYIGWPLAMFLTERGYGVVGIDNYDRRRIARETDSEALVETPLLQERTDKYLGFTGFEIKTYQEDCKNVSALKKILETEAIDTIIHLAEQPSAPYSMKDIESGSYTISNNVGSTFSVIQAVIQHNPKCHIIKLGTMGEYGTPDIDIEEGWIDVNHNGRSDRFLFPRQASSLYHTTKIMDTDLLWFYCRSAGLRVTDLMQGPVYGLEVYGAPNDHAFLPNFHYDDIFGTVLNRFVCQALTGIPLTVYGNGSQTRGYINLNDALRCIELSILNAPGEGEMVIRNQFTQLFSVNNLAEMVLSAASKIGIDATISQLPNPRFEKEDHYYHAKNDSFNDLGLQPTMLDQEFLASFMNTVSTFSSRIDPKKVMPRIKW